MLPEAELQVERVHVRMNSLQDSPGPPTWRRQPLACGKPDAADKTWSIWFWIGQDQYVRRPAGAARAKDR
jgi:hypothetical protein